MSVQTIKKLINTFTCYPKIKQGHLLEIFTVSFTKAASWNVYASNPTPIKEIRDADDYFDSIYKGLYRLTELVNNDRAYIQNVITIIELVDHVLSSEQNGQTLYQLLPSASFKIVGADPNDHMVQKQLLPMKLHEKYVNSLQPEPGNYPWDLHEEIASQSGFSKEEASLIRATQREATQHSWPVEYWVITGIIASDQLSFLKFLKAQSEWVKLFYELMETDGHSC